MLWLMLAILFVILLAGSPYAVALRMAIDRQLRGDEAPRGRVPRVDSESHAGHATHADLAKLNSLSDAEFEDRVAERLPQGWLFALLNSHYINGACLLSACAALPVWLNDHTAGRNLIGACVVSQLARWGLAIRSVRRETWARAMSDSH